MADAKITRSTTPDDVKVVDEGDGIWTVYPVWNGVDRPRGAGWGVKDRRLANRLARALWAGVVYDEVEVLVDNAGKTYAHGHAKVMGRYLNSDLRKLGF